MLHHVVAVALPVFGHLRHTVFGMRMQISMSSVGVEEPLIISSDLVQQRFVLGGRDVILVAFDKLIHRLYFTRFSINVQIPSTTLPVEHMFELSRLCTFLVRAHQPLPDQTSLFAGQVLIILNHWLQWRQAGLESVSLCNGFSLKQVLNNLTLITHQHLLLLFVLILWLH